MSYHELIGVYNAEASLVGEVKYLFNKFSGRDHCALCDISHRLAWEKDNFTAFKRSFPTPFVTRHLDELDPDALDLAQDRAPCVIGRDKDGWQVVLTRHHLEQCDRSVKQFAELMDELI